MRRLPRPRSLLARLALRTALAGFGFFVVAGGAVVAVAGRTTAGQVEDRLRSVAATLDQLPFEVADKATLCRIVTQQGPLAAADRRPDILIELVAPDGSVCRPAGTPSLEGATPTSAPIDVVIGTDLPQKLPPGGDAPILVLTEELPAGWTARIGGDLTDFRTLAGRLWTTLLVISLPGAFVAALAGFLLTRNGLRPVRNLADAAETIARTQDLSVRIDVPDAGADDEITRLATAFTAMTAALAAAGARQSQLITDAGHELRTPLTSLRANVELLVRSERAGRALPPEDREGLLDDVTGQLDELSHLVSELVVLAHDEPARPRAEVRLDEAAGRAVHRARRRADRHVVEAALEPWVVPDADAVSLERAVVNLLDNALKFSPPGSTVRVRLAGGRLTVDDEGPGIAAEHRSDAFERFWRADAARALPGSGLGLAIVADVAQSHRGQAHVEEAPGGGTRAVLTVPGSAPG